MRRRTPPAPCSRCGGCPEPVAAGPRRAARHTPAPTWEAECNCKRPPFTASFRPALPAARRRRRSRTSHGSRQTKICGAIGPAHSAATADQLCWPSAAGECSSHVDLVSPLYEIRPAQQRLRWSLASDGFARLARTADRGARPAGHATTGRPGRSYGYAPFGKAMAPERRLSLCGLLRGNRVGAAGRESSQSPEVSAICPTGLPATGRRVARRPAPA